MSNRYNNSVILSLASSNAVSTQALKNVLITFIICSNRQYKIGNIRFYIICSYETYMKLNKITLPIYDVGTGYLQKYEYFIELYMLINI